MTIRLKRIYEDIARNDGVRVLVDRVWPRGVSKEKANLDYWLKEIGPTNELRKAFHNNDITFNNFKEKYLKELKSGDQKGALDELKKIKEEHKQITLLFAAKDKEENQAVLLKEKIS